MHRRKIILNSKYPMLRLKRIDCNENIKKIETQDRESLEQGQFPESAAFYMKGLECQICFKTLPSRTDLVIHINGVHKGIEQFQCPKNACKRVFTSYSSLKYHLTTVDHSSLEEGQFPKPLEFYMKGLECQICFKALPSRTDLVIHINGVHKDI